jgi:hypothetical protein
MKSGLPGSFEPVRKRRPALRRARRNACSGAVLRDLTRAINADIRCAREGPVDNQYFR